MCLIFLHSLKKKKPVSSRAKFHTANYSMDALFIPRTTWSSSKNIASDIQNKTSKGLPPPPPHDPNNPRKKQSSCMKTRNDMVCFLDPTFGSILIDATR